MNFELKFGCSLFVLTIFILMNFIKPLKISSEHSEWTKVKYQRCLEIKQEVKEVIRTALLLPFGTSYLFYCPVCLSKRGNRSSVWHFVPTQTASFFRILHKPGEFDVEYFGSLIDRHVRHNGTYYCRERNGHFLAIYSVTVIRVWHGLQVVKHIAIDSEKVTVKPIETSLQDHQIRLSNDILYSETECNRCDQVGLTREVHACFLKLTFSPEKFSPVFNKLREFGKLPCYDSAVETLFSPDGNEIDFIRHNPVRVYYRKCKEKCTENKYSLNASMLTIEEFEKERNRLNKLVSKQRFPHQVRAVGQECIFSCFQSSLPRNSLNGPFLKLKAFYWSIAHVAQNNTIMKQYWLSPLNLSHNSDGRMGFDFLGNLYITHLIKLNFDKRYICMSQGTLNASHRLIEKHSSFSLSSGLLDNLTVSMVLLGVGAIFFQKLRNPEIDSKIY